MGLARLLVLASLLLPAAARAQNTELQGYVLGVNGDRVSVDLGRQSGLRPGDVGILRRKGARVATLEVVRVDLANAFLRVVDPPRGVTPREGDTVFFTLSAGAPPRRAGAGRGGEDEFVPLLAPYPAVRKKPVSRISTQVHGRLRLWQFFQTVEPTGTRYRISRADTDGTMDRIAGSPWSFVWSVNTSYRDGNTTSTSDDFRKPRARPQRLMLSRPLGARGFLRAGRFYTNELPALGAVDGAAAQLPASGLKLGVVAGARPDRRYNGFSSTELLASVYASAEAGTPGKGHYAATVGALHTRWKGKSDEAAVLIDQRADFGPLLSVYETAQLDFDAGAAAVHKGTRLTRLDLSLNSMPLPWLTARGGASHYEPIDVEAERAIAGIDPVLYIDNGYWRYWTGAGQTLPWGLSLDEEVSWMRANDRFQPGLGRLTAARAGLPGMPNGRVYVTGYNVNNPAGADYGVSTGLSNPFWDGKLGLDVNAGFRYDRGDEDRKRWKAGDAGLRLDWRPNRTWSADISATRVWLGSVRSTSVSGGVAYRW